MRPDDVDSTVESAGRGSLAGRASWTPGEPIETPLDGEPGTVFAPVRIGPGRRSLERTFAAVIGVVLLIGLAIAKPWAAPEPGADRVVVSPAASPAVAAAPTRPYSSAAAESAPPPPSLEDVADWWSVLGTDYGFVSGRLLGAEPPAPGVIVSTLTIWRQRPATVPLVPERLRPDGSPAAVVPVDTTVIGVTVPRAEAPTSIRVHRQFEGGRAIEVPIRTMPLGDRGIWLVVPLDGGGWQPGLYAVRLAGPAGTRWLNVCVASRPVGTGGPVLDPTAWSAEAYEQAVRRYGRGIEVVVGDGASNSPGSTGRRAPVAPRPK